MGKTWESLGEIVARTFIYFIGSSDGPIKIGKAKNVKSRLASIQTGSAEKLSVMGVMFSDERLERALHKKFKHISMHGEWFRRDQDLLSFIDEHTVAFESVAVMKSIPKEEKSDAKPIVVRRLNWTGEIPSETKEKLRTEILDRYLSMLTDDLANLWLHEIEIFRRVLDAYKSIDQAIRFHSKEEWALGGDHFWKLFRDSIKSLCDVDWRLAEMIILNHGGDGKPFDLEALKIQAENKIRKSRYALTREPLVFQPKSNRKLVTKADLWSDKPA